LVKMKFFISLCKNIFLHITHGCNVNKENNVAEDMQPSLAQMQLHGMHLGCMAELDGIKAHWNN